MTLKVLIADDEMLARRRLIRLLSAMPMVEVVGECASGEAVLERISQEPRPDTVMLDINMPGLSGVEAMGLWPQDGPRIIFTTAHAEHAITAFEGGAADYLLKPIEASRLRKALERVQPTPARAPTAAPTTPDGRLPLATRSGVVLLAPGEIRCVLIEGESVVLQTDRGEFFTDLRLSELEGRLPPASFLRVHRRALVNMQRVLRMEALTTGGYLAHTDGGESVPVSRKVARDLRRLWNL